MSELSIVYKSLEKSVSGCGSVWLEHLVWDQGVASSNLVTPTIDRLRNDGIPLFLSFLFQEFYITMCYSYYYSILEYSCFHIIPFLEFRDTTDLTLTPTVTHSTLIIMAIGDIDRSMPHLLDDTAIIYVIVK